MALLVTLRGPEMGRHFQLLMNSTTVGRQLDCQICLSGRQVSRQHAQIIAREGKHFVEDLGSSNGTYLNGKRITPHAPEPITDRDTLQIGPYLFALRHTGNAVESEFCPTIRETVTAGMVSQSLFGSDSAAKLQVVLEIAQQLARNLDLDPLLDKLLEQLMRLFPQADRCMFILCDGENLIPRAQSSRNLAESQEYAFSRTIAKRVLEEGVGIISDDVQHDHRFQRSQTITSLNLHSTMCVPLINYEQKRLAVLQVDRFCKGSGFRIDDLQLLSAVAMQVAVVLENVHLHAERLNEERLLQELALAQEIQQSYLPEDLENEDELDFEILGRVFPARTVAGDFYDYMLLADGALSFSIGDVSGKGMPAALFLVAVRTLSRHIAKEKEAPARLLAKLNRALAEDNPSCLFVTLTFGTYDAATGNVLLASAGHPLPFLRKADGTVETIPLKPGRLLGYEDVPLKFDEVSVHLEPGDTLFFFTDGFFETRGGEGGKTQFGLERLKTIVRDFRPNRDLAECAEQAKSALDVFAGPREQQDDLTLLLLRRRLRSDGTS